MAPGAYSYDSNDDFSPLAASSINALLPGNPAKSCNWRRRIIAPMQPMPYGEDSEEEGSEEDNLAVIGRMNDFSVHKQSLGLYTRQEFENKDDYAPLVAPDKKKVLVCPDKHCKRRRQAGRSYKPLLSQEVLNRHIRGHNYKHPAVLLDRDSYQENYEQRIALGNGGRPGNNTINVLTNKQELERTTYIFINMRGKEATVNGLVRYLDKC